MIKLSDALKADLLTSMPIEQIFQKHIIDGKSHFFNHIIKEPNLEYELRHDISETLNININDVIIVGSAKTGFSVKSEKFYEFDYEFKKTKNRLKKSDIDIAVVNRTFYDDTLEAIFHLSRHFDPDWIKEHWKINDFYKKNSDIHSKYSQYIARGWLRPDCLPISYYSEAAWRPICQKWYEKTNKRKISIGVYSDWKYLKHYQMDNLEKLKIKMVTLGTK